MTPTWILILAVPASAAAGWFLSGWQQRRGAERAMDRLLIKELAPPSPGEIGDRLYLDLKGARERLCRATTGMNPADAAILQGALDRIDLVACDLPQWSRHDGGRT